MFLTVQNMCDKAVRDDTFSLVCVPHWFVAQEQIELWDDGNDYYGDDDEIINWYEAIKNARPRK